MARWWKAIVLGILAVSGTVRADLGEIVTGSGTPVSDDAGYNAAADRALARGGNVLFLADLHLATKVDGNGKLVLDESAPENQRLARIREFLKSHPGKITQIVWMGDMLDAKGPKAIAERIGLMETVVKSVAAAAKLPATASRQSDQANHIFVMGNHDVPADDAKYDAAERKYKAEKAAYEAKLEAWKKHGGPFPGMAPHPMDRDEFDDPKDTRDVLESWRKMGYVATERPGDVATVLLKGFDRPELGRRNKVMLSHYPVGVGGDLQVLPSSDRRTLDKLAREDRNIRLGGDDVFARIFADIHTPRRIEEPIVELRNGKLVRKQNPSEKDRTYLVADPGSLSQRRGEGKDSMGNAIQLDPSFAVLTPADGLFHFRVGEKEVSPYALPASQRSFGIPTGPINHDPAKARLFDRAYGPVLDGSLPMLGRFPLPVLSPCTSSLRAVAG